MDRPVRETGFDIRRNQRTHLFELYVDGKFEGNFDTVDEAVREWMDICKKRQENEASA